MSRIQSQGFWNTIFSYTGAAIGVVNLIFLYPFYLNTDEIGLIRILTSVSILYAQVASFGFNSAILRFFPHYRSRQGAGFPAAVLVLTLAGFLVATFIALLFRPVVESVYLESSALFVRYYPWLIPLSLFVMLFSLAESFLRALYKTVASLFLREVLLRLLTTFGVVAIIAGWFTFEWFMVWYIAIHGIILILLLVGLIREQAIRFNWVPGFFRYRRIKKVMQYGLVSLFAGATSSFITIIDSLMIGAYLTLDDVGIYSIAFFMGSVIAIPARGISRIAVPMVAEAWKKNRPDKIAVLYARTSLLHFAIGLFILTGILINLQAVFTFLPDAFAAGALVVFWIGTGHLIDITGGINGYILITSRRYHNDLLFNLAFIALSVVTNLLLIPVYGITGAAMASALSYLGINAIRTVYIWRAFSMHPFNRTYLKVALPLLAAGFAAGWIPLTGIPALADILFRSILFTVLAVGLGYVTGVSRLLQTALAELKGAEY